MKTLPATSVAKNCGEYLDAVQQEPVVITKKDRPVAVTISIKHAQELTEALVEAGINRGLEDVRAGRVTTLTDQTAANMLAKFKSQHPNVWK